jgi:excisionase family DNA binding protein
MQPSKYVPVKEIASFFEVTDAAIYKWAAQGKIRHQKLGRKVLITREEFAYIQANGLRNPEDEGVLEGNLKSLGYAVA